MDWLHRRINEDLESSWEFERARALTLLGASDNETEGLRLAEWIKRHPDCWLRRVAELAHLRSTRNRWAHIWFERFLTRPQEIRVKSLFIQPYQDETTRVRRQELVQETLAAIQALDAFLIVDGKRHLPLNQPVLTLGRRTENDIVLSLPDVSRQHAQIRWRFGRVVIHDLGSRAGTKVNGNRIQECVLQPGDVIVLSNAILLYGEGGGNQEARRPIANSTKKKDATLVRMAPRKRSQDG